MEWNQFSYALQINAVVHNDLINLKINGSKKSPFQILGSDHCNFLLPFPDRTNLFFAAVLDPVTLCYSTITPFRWTQIVQFQKEEDSRFSLIFETCPLSFVIIAKHCIGRENVTVLQFQLLFSQTKYQRWGEEGVSHLKSHEKYLAFHVHCTCTYFRGSFVRASY